MVAPAEIYTPRIANAILDRVESCKFPELNWDVTGRVSLGVPLLPQSKQVRPGPTTTFLPARRNRQHGYLQERIDWVWHLHLKFDRAVSLEAFENSLANDPPSIPRDAGHDRQVDILIIERESFEPPNLNPATGTSALFRFNARLTPV